MVKVEKRYLITKGEMPKSGSGGKASFQEKLLFIIITILIVAILVFIFK
jgi:hypothetical protein